MTGVHDWAAGRAGQWMQTSLGGRFFPLDPRPEEVHVSDVANGLALDCRYAGQGAVDRYYSVAEHSFHMTCYAQRLGWPPGALLATLLHDAAEAYLNDLPRAVKRAVGTGYTWVEGRVQAAVEQRFGVEQEAKEWKSRIKSLDNRIIANEKAAIMRHPQPWAFDQYASLDGVVIHCWNPPQAKKAFLEMYVAVCIAGGFPVEEHEI
ncbi:hypothetical protein LCGC14_1886250 [marine sediment metagenome]|uniref:HD domain-containing protein n=1 Tax=marine sediment metagenome TaxID=412755 RepID=A0A0F9GP75_9ZZZZ